MDLCEVPIPAPEHFDRAAQCFDRSKPNGTKVAGLAIIIQAIGVSFWSVNYEVVADNFPIPCVENCVRAKSQFQSKAPPHTNVHQVEVCEIKPGGLVIDKWQVKYSVSQRAQGERKDKVERKKKSEVVKSKQTGNFRVKDCCSKTKNEERGTHVADRGFNDMLTVLKKTLNETKKVRAKMSNAFVSKQNVFSFSNSDVKRWFSKPKRNFTFGLKRILRKQRNQKKVEIVDKPLTFRPIKFQKASENVAEEINHVTRVEKPFLNVNVYEDFEVRLKLSDFLRIGSHDRTEVHAALHHVVNCKRLKRSQAECAKASDLLRRHDMIMNKSLAVELLKLLNEKFSYTEDFFDSYELLLAGKDYNTALYNPAAVKASQLCSPITKMGFIGNARDNFLCH